MSYALDDMVTKFRMEMDDTVEPYLWSDGEVVDYLDQAEDEFCSAVDALTTELPRPFSAGATTVTLPYYVTRVRSAETSDGLPIKMYNAEDWRDRQACDDYGLSSFSSTWRTDTGTRLKAVITDLEEGKVRLYPIPEADGTMLLHVYSRPSRPLADRGAFAVADRMHQRTILLKARALAYAKHDAETYNPAMSAEYDAKYQQAVASASNHVSRRRRRAGTVAYPEM